MSSPPHSDGSEVAGALMLGREDDHHRLRRVEVEAIGPPPIHRPIYGRLQDARKDTRVGARDQQGRVIRKAEGLNWAVVKEC